MGPPLVVSMLSMAYSDFSSWPGASVAFHAYRFDRGFQQDHPQVRTYLTMPRDFEPAWSYIQAEAAWADDGGPIPPAS